MQNTVVIDAFPHLILPCSSGTPSPHSVQTLVCNWLYRHRTHLCEPDHSPSSTPFATPPASALPPTLPPQDIRHVRYLLSRQAHREIRLKQYTRVKALSDAGKTPQRIADASGISVKTVH